MRWDSVDFHRFELNHNRHAPPQTGRPIVKQQQLQHEFWTIQNKTYNIPELGTFVCGRQQEQPQTKVIFKLFPAHCVVVRVGCKTKANPNVNWIIEMYVCVSIESVTVLLLCICIRTTTTGRDLAPTCIPLRIIILIQRRWLWSPALTSYYCQLLHSRSVTGDRRCPVDGIWEEVKSAVDQTSLW